MRALDAGLVSVRLDEKCELKWTLDFAQGDKLQAQSLREAIVLERAVVVRDARHAAQVRRLEELLPKVIYTRVRQCMRVLRVSCVVPRRAQLRCVRSTRRRRRKKKGSHCTDAFEQVGWEDPEARIGGDRPVLPSVVATPAAIEGRLRVEEIAHHDLGRVRRARVSGQASFFGEGGGDAPVCSDR